VHKAHFYHLEILAENTSLEQKSLRLSHLLFFRLHCTGTLLKTQIFLHVSWTVSNLPDLLCKTQYKNRPDNTTFSCRNTAD